MSQRRIAEAVVAKMKASSAPVAMDQSDDGGDASSTHSASEVSSEASSSSRPSFSLRDQSPFKEAILTKFAKLSAANSIADQPASLPVGINSDPDEHPHLPQSSWLHNVKGRIAKTVEEKKREYSELKAERELRRHTLLHQQAGAGTDLVKRETASLHGSIAGGGGGSDERRGCGGSEDEFVRAYEDETACLEGSHRDLSLSSDSSTVTMSHSVSESRINESGTVSSGVGDGNSAEVCSSLPDFRTSQSFDEFIRKDEQEEEEEDQEEDLKTPLLFETEEPDGAGQAANKATPKISRFAFFSSSRSANVTPKKEEFVDRFPASEPNPTVSANSATATPTRATLRQRVMGFMGKTPSGRGSLNLRELGGSAEDPFSMGSLEPSPVTEENSVIGGNVDDDEDSVEEAVEADELLVYDPASDDASDPLHSDEADVGGIDGPLAVGEDSSLLSNYWWVASLPVCAVILVQFLPLPSWVLGFLSGSVLSAFLIAFWKYLKFVRDPNSGTRFIENVRKRLPNKPAIIVQEELEREYTWMNIWPHKNGPYDPLTYDVRRTMSVRVMVHGPWVELKFPKRNLPLRRMFNDVEPNSVAFIDHKEVIDLTNCHIDLIPENLPNKRTWSKKYPIRIRTNMRLPCKDQATNRETHPDDPSHAPDPVARAKSEPDSEGGEDSPVTENAADQATSEDFEREEGEPLAEIFKDPLTAMAEQEEARRRKMEEEGIFDDDEFDEVSDTDKGKEVSKGEYMRVPGDDEPDEDDVKTFYLFTRTSREKEEWFNRLMVGAKFMQDWNHQNPPPARQVKPDPNYETFKVKGQKFKLFMEDYFQARHDEGAQKVHEMTRSDENRQQIAREQMAFVNIFGARLWHDLHDSTAFIDLLREKLTRKLLKVKIAQYFEEVRVTTLDLGQRLPQVQSVSLPWQDEAGLWMNLEIEYGGIMEATVDTRGIRLPSKDEPLDREAAEFVKRATMDSDEEDSAEDDSADERENTESDLFAAVNNRNSGLDAASGGSGGSGGSSGSAGGGAGGKGEPHVHGAGFKVRMIEGLLKSDFVARLAEKEWVKKNITEQCITLQLQLHSVKGTLTLNVPPSPSDRLWYGFHTPPEMQLALRPSFGGRSLGKYESWITSVMRRLEDRLKEEFVKVLVYPNLDDIVLPGMDHVPYQINEAVNVKEEDHNAKA